MRNAELARAWRRILRRERAKAAALAVVAIGAAVMGWIVVSAGGFVVAALVLARARIATARAIAKDPAMRTLMEAAGARVDPAALPRANLVK